MKFCPTSILLGLLTLTVTPVFAHPCETHEHYKRSAQANATYVQDLQNMLKGNKAFQAQMSKQNPGLLKTLAIEGQKPPFMLFDCSDSRVSEQDIFSAKPGTMFTAGNIANQFLDKDISSHSVLSYAVDALGVRHVVVMGHYGCGGVAAAMTPPGKPPKHAAKKLVQEWIQPIRDLYATSKRPEIVAYRKQKSSKSKRSAAGAPELHDPAFRALVEENVKASVERITKSAVIKEHFASLSKPSKHTTPVDVFIHGWVYDIENGEVRDLGVSVGPPGKKTPESPFPSVKGKQ